MSITSKDETKALEGFDKLAYEVRDLKNRPLLVMYYPDKDGYMTTDDVRDVHDELRRRGFSRDNVAESLDVLLHTYGGDPNSAYRVAQVIRDFARNVDFLIPFHAYSGGTLTCFCANNIRLGAYSCLSPIDITLEEIELASIDYYMEFAQKSRQKIEEMLNDFLQDASKEGSPIVRPRPTTDVERHLLVEMVKQVGALNVGRYFRERTLTGHYAIKLLSDYMFAKNSNKQSLCDDIANKILFEFPSHEFEMDYHICKDLGLPVSEMNDAESEKTKSLVDELDELTDQGIICKQLDETYKAPFIRLYPLGEKV
jgi:hypothetical protein